MDINTISLKKTLNILCYISLACFITSCMSMQSKSVVILNPDMSGKCSYDIKMGKDMAGILTTPKDDIYSGMGFTSRNTKKTGQDAAMALASKLLSSGSIDAWKDVQFGYLGKDTVFFKGTAYFKDISKMAVSMLDSSMRIYKNGEGNMVLEMLDSKPKKDSTMAWQNHSYDSITNSIYKNIGLSDMMHYYMACMVKGLYISATYQLPGKIISSSNFVRKNDNTVSVTLTGNDVIKLIDSMSVNNDMIGSMYSKYMPSMGLGGNNSSGLSGGCEDTYQVDKILYGEAKPVQVVFKNTNKMTFDYEKEVTEAKAYYAKFRRSSGLEQYDSSKAAEKKQEEEEKQKEQGTLVLTAADSSGNKVYIKTLAASQLYGDYVTFNGTFSRFISSNSTAKVQLTKAVADNGANMMDSINKKNSNYSYYDTTAPAESVISAYLSSSNYSYNDSISLSETESQNDKLTFSVSIPFPEGVKYVNLEGVVELTSQGSIVDMPFKIIKLYAKTKDDNSLFGKWK